MLGPGLVTTQTSCSVDGEVTHTSIVGSVPLDPVAHPLDGRAFTELWAEVAGPVGEG